MVQSVRIRKRLAKGTARSESKRLKFISVWTPGELK
jgi:hypothetical protein